MFHYRIHMNPAYSPVSCFCKIHFNITFPFTPTCPKWSPQASDLPTKILHAFLTSPKHNTTLCPKVSGLTAWYENCKRYSSLPLGAVVSLFCKTV